MKSLPLFVLLLSATLWPFTVPTVWADELACLDCHEDETAGSVHEGLVACQDCHEDVKDASHEDKGAKPVNCASCHDDYAQATAQDIHHRLKERVGKKGPNCQTCHGGHQIRAPSQSKDPVQDYCAGCHDNIVLVNPFHTLKPVADRVCLECHEDARPFVAQLDGSVHKRFACTDCHAYVASHLEEHQENMTFTQVADCYLCHRKEALTHRESIHGISIAEGINEAANCWNCHGGHDTHSVEDPASRVYPANLAQTCGACHDDPKFEQQFALGIKFPGKLYSQSVHGELVKKGRMDAANCVLCHGAHDIKNRVQPGSTISAFAVPETCGHCHQEISGQYEQSIHWVRAKQGVRDAPVCNDCHSEHNIRAITTVQKNGGAREIQEETCFQCHSNPIIARRYSLGQDRTVSYRDSYHGMAALRGAPNVAMCVDCHGKHKILPRNHPESKVNPKNVEKTCRICHPDANLAFAQSYSHVTTTPVSSLIEYWVEVIYIWVIWITIGGMLLHNGLILGFEVGQRRRRTRDVISVQRFTRNEVIQHLLLSAAFILLAITGFALKYSQIWAFHWLEWIGMTEVVRRYLHRGAGVVLLALGAYHLVYLIATRRGRAVVRSLLLRLSDLRGFLANMAYYLRLRKHPPEFGEFDYTEKVEYWALIWGTLVMGVTGIVLWFPTDVALRAPEWTIKVSELIHFYEAVLATLAIMVWHWFFVIFHPSVYPLNFTMVDGRIALDSYGHHHRLEFKRIVLNWMRMKTGRIERYQLDHYTERFLAALEREQHDPDALLQAELERDADLRTWVQARLEGR